MTKQKYSEGDKIENNFLEAFRNNDQVKLREMLDSGIWNYKYHLSPVRENILNWYDFKPGAKILEVGAGMGAVTGAFLDRGLNVDALELEDRRAEILKERWKSAKDFNVIKGNILDYKTEEKYDYVICIGVLEYSGRFVETKQPYLDFVKTLKRFLKADGKVIIAIENKFGLKYWTGAPEDHTGRYFDGLESYPIDTGVKTFSKLEITELLYKAGLNDLYFYYPLPDYKFPQEVFSQDYLPSMKHNIGPNLLKAGQVHKREFLMDERRVFDGIVSNNEFEFFANSFLIFAGK